MKYIIILILSMWLTSCSVCNENDKVCLEKQDKEILEFNKRGRELENIYIEQCLKFWWLPEVSINWKSCDIIK